MDLWTVDDVSAWLTSLELHSHAAAFRASAIDGPLLADLSAEDLASLGVTNKFHSRKLLQRRDKLLADGTSAGRPSWEEAHNAAAGEFAGGASAQLGPSPPGTASERLAPFPQPGSPLQPQTLLPEASPNDSEVTRAGREQIQALLLRGRALGPGGNDGPDNIGSVGIDAAVTSLHNHGAARLRAHPPSPPPLELSPSEVVLQPRKRGAAPGSALTSLFAPGSAQQQSPSSRFTASQEEVSDLLGLLQDAVPAPAQVTPGAQAPPPPLAGRPAGVRSASSAPPPDPGAAADAAAALGALRRAGDSPGDAEQALLALCSVSRRSQSAAAAVLTSGAPPAIVAAMRQHGIGHAGVAAAASSAVCALCGLPLGFVPCPSKIAEIRDARQGVALPLGLAAFGDARAAEPLLACASAHASTAPVASATLAALAVLTAGSVLCAVQAADVASGGVDALVVALYVHADAPTIQASGCTALAALLAARPERRRPALAAGAAEVVQYAQRRHAQHAAVQEAAQAAADALHDDDDGSSATPAPALSHEAPPPVSAADLAASADHVEMQNAATADDRGGHDAQQHHVAASNADVAPPPPPPPSVPDESPTSATLLIQALRADGGVASPDQVASILQMLATQWSTDATGTSAMSFDAGGVGAVIAAMRAHATNVDAVAAGLACLVAAVSGAGDAQRREAARVVAAGGVALAAQALRQHVSNAGVCATACAVLTALAPECSDAQDAAAAAVATASAASAHSQDATLAAAAKRARYALSFAAANGAAAAAGVAAVTSALRKKEDEAPQIAAPVERRTPVAELRADARPAAHSAQQSQSGDSAASFEAFAATIASPQGGPQGASAGTSAPALVARLLTGLRTHGRPSPACAVAACDALIALLSSSPAAGVALWDPALDAANAISATLDAHLTVLTPSSRQQHALSATTFKAATSLASAFALFADDENATQQALDAGCAPLLVRCIAAHQQQRNDSSAGATTRLPLSQALATAAATTASALGAGSAVADALISAGALDVAVSALWVCAGRPGGIPAIGPTAGVNLSNVSLAAALAGLLQALSAAETHCEAAGHARACEAVLACCPASQKTMVRPQPPDMQLLCALAAALRNLTVSSANRARVMAAAGAPAIVALLEAATVSTPPSPSPPPPPAVLLAEHACGTLRNLACDAGAAEALVRSGAPAAAVHALKTHSQWEDASEVAAAALANLTAGSAQAADQVAAARGVEALCAAMRGGAADRELQSVCAFALANVCSCGTAHDALAQQGGIAALLNALRAGYAPVAVLATALANVARSKQANEAAQHNGAAFVLLHALRDAQDGSAVHACAVAIHALCAASTSTASAFFAAGAQEALMTAARMHPEASEACGTAAAVVLHGGGKAGVANGAPPVEGSASTKGHTPSTTDNARSASPHTLVTTLVSAVSSASCTAIGSALRSCASFATDDPSRVALASAGGITAACDALDWAMGCLQEHAQQQQQGGADVGSYSVGHEVIVTQAALLVSTLAQPPGSSTAVAASEMASVLASALAWRPSVINSHGGNCPALAACLSAIASCANSDPRNAQRLASCGVAQRCGEALQTLGPACDDVAEAGCRALCLLGPVSFQSGAAAPHALHAAIGAITAAAQAHGSHSGVQYWADRALHALQGTPPASPPPGQKQGGGQAANASAAKETAQESATATPPPSSPTASPGTTALTALAAAGSDARAAEAALAALISAASASSEDAQALCTAGAVGSVIDVLRTCSRSSAVAMRGLAALAELAHDPTAAEEGAAAGAVHSTVATMRHHAAVASVQQEGCRALVRLCASPGVAAQVASGDMAAVVVAAINEHVAHMGVQSWGRRLLTALDAAKNGKPPPPLDDRPTSPASNNSGSPRKSNGGFGSGSKQGPRAPRNAPSPSSNGGGAAPVAAVPASSPEAIEAAQRVSSMLVPGTGEAPRDPARDVDGVIQALRTHMGDADVCEKGLNVMATLATRGLPHRAALGASTAAATATSCLAAHPEHPGVARKACAALQAMATPLGGRDATPTMEDVACACAVDAARPDAALAASLRALAGTDIAAASAACSAIAAVAVLSQDAAVRAVTQGDALACVMATLRVRAPSAPPHLGAAALEALAALTEARTEALVLDAGATDCIVHVMRVHTDSAAVASAAAHALAALAASPAGCVRIATAGGVLAMLRAMRAHAADKSVQAAVLSALWNATVTSDNQARTTAAGGTELVTEALRRFGIGSAPVAEAACGCVRNLACDPSAGHRLAAAGAVGGVLGALRVHGASNPDFTDLAQAALGNLLASPAACVAVLKLHARDDAQAVALSCRALVSATDPEQGLTAPHAAQAALRAAQGAGLTLELARSLTQLYPVGSIGDVGTARKWVLQLLDVLQRHH